MEQFALVGMRDGEYRYIKNHPLLKFLPIKWARAMIPKKKPRLTEIIYGKYNDDELGYIVDVPGFFRYRDKLEGSVSIENLDNLINILREKGIKILVFPQWRDFISLEERYYLEENSIILLDGSVIRLVSLMAVVERLFTILRGEVHEMEVGIWGADNRVGQIWAKILGFRLNYLIIGGENKKNLEELSNEILYHTGLSCQVTNDSKDCLSNKSMIILSSAPEDWQELVNSRIIILSYGLPNANLSTPEEHSFQDKIFIESGWPILSHDMQVKNNLGAWDEIAIAEAGLFIRDDVYRRLLTGNSLTLENLEIIKRMITKYGINFTGFLSKGRIISYNGFRKLYFGNYLDNFNSDIL